jgi:hypothetical protein
MDGAGNMSITDIYLSSPPPESSEGIYEVFEDDHGLILLNVGDGVDYFTGAISSDGQVFFVVDTYTDESDDELGLTVGLKKTK